MAAAYAALNSLMYILQQIHDHPRPPITLEIQHMDSLCEIIRLLQDFLENYSHIDIGDGKEALESQIANAAYAAEDVIETHIVDQILAKSNFQEEDNFIDLFSRGVKKMIRTLASSSSHQTDHQIHTGDRGRSSNSLFCQDLQKVIEDMYLIKKEVIEIQEKIVAVNDDQPSRHNISMSTNIIGSSTVPPSPRKNTNTVVGLDDVLTQIIDRLTGHTSDLQVLPIVGMGGIGKTTLARHAYNNTRIGRHFDIRIWVTISQEYRLRYILLDALSCDRNDENKSNEHELGRQLYKRLKYRRYLIILDDLWGIEPWEELKLFFPDDNNGSRIMITTRLSNVSDHFGSCGFKMNFLDQYKSWNLLCVIAFPQDQRCPPELEEIGKEIARNCKGLPLSIAVIGGLLAKSETTQQRWEYIAENLNRIINLDDDRHCLKILNLSYNHLPIHLKPCFLYMGVFPEDTVIRVSRLKRLWVAEGFLKPIAAESLEVVAEEYLKDIIDRNLILVHGRRSSGKVKYCKIHDLLRDLCLRECEKDKFLWVSEGCDFDKLKGIQSQRRISVYDEGASERDYVGRVLKAVPSASHHVDRVLEAVPSASNHVDRVLEAVPSASLARSLIFNCKGAHMLSHSLRLVRVFTMGSKNEWNSDTHDRYSLKDAFELVNSRYLEFNTKRRSNSIFPSSIHLLWNLQALSIYGPNKIFDVSPEFWKMSQLRYVKFDRYCPLHPRDVPLIHEGDDEFILKNLHTLTGVMNLRLSEEVIKRIPNIKKLKIYYHDFGDRWWHDYCLNNLGLLLELESLHIVVCSKRTFPIELVKNRAFPRSLKKLTLLNPGLLWKDMSVIGALPHLEILRLTGRALYGSEWNPLEGEFRRLKFLKIAFCDLEYWNANNTHFPCLEQLELVDLMKLKEIPLEIGQISTLRSIELHTCSNSAVMSAKDILDEQVGNGNEDFLDVQVRNGNIDFLFDFEHQLFEAIGRCISWFFDLLIE